MKRMVVALICTLFTLTGFAQEPLALLRLSEDKVYNPRAKGLKDLVVDFVNPQVSKQLSDQMIFGHVKEVTFRVYWTAEPERIAIEILGLPDGFREIKEELKAAMIGRFETIIPVPLEKRLVGYQFRTDPKKPRTVMATDQTHQKPIPEFELVFDASGVITSLIAKKPVGVVTTTFNYQKASWSDPRQALSSTETKAVEGAQSVEAISEVAYLVTSGMGLPSVLKTVTKQTLKIPGSAEKPMERSVSETLFFRNYKVNSGAATKWFLGQQAAAPKAP